MICRHCSSPLDTTFLDLGFAPPSNAYLEDLEKPETYFPLKLKVCTSCWLVQTEDYAKAETFFAPDYAYFSSTSSTWLEHAAAYVKMIVARLSLDRRNRVVEIASNDGYLLRNFLPLGIPCLGIEPTASTASAAEALGIPVIKDFFGEALASRLEKEGKPADLIIGNNVLAHVPDINDFCKGVRVLLHAEGTVTFEFPHLLRLIESVQFDTVYHEHFSYLSLGTVASIFERARLRIYDVEEVSTHGGSLRIYGCRDESTIETRRSVQEIIQKEIDFGLRSIDAYLKFQTSADLVKNEFLAFLLDARRKGLSVAAYGAAAKGNTLLNYAGVKPDLIRCVYDMAKSKQGKFLPGSHLPIVDPRELAEDNPDVLIVLPWNIAEEVVSTTLGLNGISEGVYVAIPRLRRLL